MDAMNDGNLRQLCDGKRASLEIPDHTDMPGPLDLTCRVCGKGIAYPGPQDRKIINKWNRKVGTPCFTCTECRQVEEQRRQQETLDAAQQRRQSELDAIRDDLPGALARCKVPEHWRAASFDLCPDLPNALTEAVHQWAEDPEGLLYLYGIPGSGKTWLAVAALSHILEENVFPPSACRYIAERDYLEGLKAAFSLDAPPISPRLLPGNHPRRVKLLIYDDLAAERQTDWARGEIAKLIEDQHATNLATIITSNVALSGVAQAVDGRIASRIAESRLMLEFPPCDLRIKGTLRRL